MVDPGTGLTILGSAIGGKKILEKILGPSADYIGDQLKEWTKKSVNNVKSIFKNAEKKLGNKINETGSVHPKVLKSILEDGAWCEDELQVEYFGGVLASARSGVSRDDRGAYFTSLISRLTTYQLRTHYILYQCLKKYFDGQKLNIGSTTDRKTMELFISFDTYVNAMDFQDDESNNIHNIIPHAIFGLTKEDLIGQYFNYGDVNYLKKYYPEATEAGIIFTPTHLGIELLMWAYGLGKETPNDFFLKKTKFKDNQKIKWINCNPTKQKR